MTGGAGFIGSKLVRKLAEEGHLVAVVDDFSTGKAERLTDLDGHAVIVCPMDVSANAQALEDLVSMLRPETVFHLAAVSDVTTCEADRCRAQAVNILGTASVFRAAQRTRSVKRLVFASSAAVYGNQDPPPGGHLEAVDEIFPSGVYGWSKLWGEWLMDPEGSDCSVLVLRFGNVYGSHEAPGVIPTFFRAAEMRSPLLVYGDGEQTRDFVHVDDVVSALCLCGENVVVRGSHGFNIATGKPTSINGLVAWFKTVYEGLDVHYEPARDADVVESALNPERLRSETGFVAQVTIEQGLSMMKEELDRERCCQA